MVTDEAVHLVHNNAGAMGPRKDSMLDITEDEWDWFMDLNLNSVLHGCRLFAKSMHLSGEEGFIINTSSIYGLASATSAYGITKQSVVAISEAFQSSLKALDSKVTCLSFLSVFLSFFPHFSLISLNLSLSHFISHFSHMSLDSKVMVSSLCPSFISTDLGKATYDKQAAMEGDSAAWMQGILANGPGPDFVAKCVFNGIEQGDHYIHTHPDVSAALFEDRVAGILGNLRVTTERHDVEMARIGLEAGLEGG